MIRRTCFALIVLCSTLAPSVSAQRIELPEKLKKLEQRVVQDSNDAAAHFNVACAYWNEKRWDEAQAALRTAVSIEPQFAEAYLALAMLPYAERPRLWDEIFEDDVPDDLQPVVEESDRLYRRAFLVDPLVNLRMIGASTPKAPTLISEGGWEFYELFFKGFDDINQGKYEDGHARLQRLVRQMNWDRFTQHMPNSVALFRGLAAAHVERYDEAAADLQLLLDRQLEEERKDSLVHVPLRTNEYRYLLANVKHRAGDLVTAERLYREALEHDMGLYMGHVQLARIYESVNDLPHAIEERRYAIAANPDDPSLVMDLGVTLGKAGHWRDAEIALREAMQANPRDARVPYFLGIVMQQLGDAAEASAAFERFLDLAPSRYAQQIADAKKRLGR
jgi:tetratricopeptide (TPR) repeat protein